MNDDFFWAAGRGCPASSQRQGCRTDAWPVKIEGMKVALRKAKSWEASGTTDVKDVEKERRKYRLNFGTTVHASGFFIGKNLLFLQ